MEYLSPFFMGGSFIAGAKLISTHLSPEFASLIAGMPTGMLAVFFLNNQSEKVKYYNGYIYVTITTSLMVIISYLLCNNTTMHVNIISAIAFGLWAIISFMFIWTNKRQK